jgi:hypothetical protein
VGLHAFRRRSTKKFTGDAQRPSAEAGKGNRTVGFMYAKSLGRVAGNRTAGDFSIFGVSTSHRPLRSDIPVSRMMIFTL